VRSVRGRVNALVSCRAALGPWLAGFASFAADGLARRTAPERVGPVRAQAARRRPPGRSTPGDSLGGGVGGWGNAARGLTRQRVLAAVRAAGMGAYSGSPAGGLLFAGLFRGKGDNLALRGTTGRPPGRFLPVSPFTPFGRGGRLRRRCGLEGIELVTCRSPALCPGALLFLHGGHAATALAAPPRARASPKALGAGAAGAIARGRY